MPVSLRFRSPVIALSFLAMGLMLLGTDAVGSTLVSGDEAPALEVTTLGGDAFVLSKAKGQVVVVTFWATWCEPCREELKVLDRLYRARREDHGTTRLQVIALSLNRGRERRQVVDMTSALSFPVALLSEAKINGFAKPNATPLTYVVDPLGKVAHVFAPGGPPLTLTTLEEVLRPLLAESQATTPHPYRPL